MLCTYKNYYVDYSRYEDGSFSTISFSIYRLPDHSIVSTHYDYSAAVSIMKKL